MDTFDSVVDSPMVAVSRTLLVLELLTAEPGAMGVNEVANRLRVNRGTAHRILASLLHHGYVRRNPGGHYEPTTKLNVVAASNVRLRDLHSMAQPVLEELAEKTRELTQLAVLDGEQMIFLVKADGPERLRVGAAIGTSVQPHCTSAGMVWLAALPEARRRVLLDEWAPLTAMTQHTVTDVDELLAIAKRVASDGFATVHEEFLLGVSTLGAPVTGPGGRFVAAVTLSGPSTRLTDDHMAAVIPTLLEAATKLSTLWVYS